MKMAWESAEGRHLETAGCFSHRTRIHQGVIIEDKVGEEAMDPVYQAPLFTLQIGNRVSEG